MSTIKVNFNKEIDKIRIMHAVNNGPVVAGSDQTRGNQDAYKAARIPYARTHDASFYAGYGGNHTVDVNFIFPDFDADVNDPNSYDFACTDLYMKQIIDYGAKPFFRLGSKIEHEVKKYNTFPPKDFKKWAEICEHIIEHYTEGWADGFYYDIEYWEIWNEPDLDAHEENNKRCWQGTFEEFVDFFSTSAKHLKNRFPNLKIGGPASCGDEEWSEAFLKEIKKKDTPLDFFSYHWYWTQPYDMTDKCTRVRKMLDRCGYENAETNLNEWNYVRGWSDEFVYSIKQIIGMKGAAFTSACMSACQNCRDVDMIMYYDARPGTFNGLFDFYTMEPLKGYYPFYIYANLYEMENQIEAICDDKDIYVVGAKNSDKCGLMVTYYSENDNDGAKKVTLDIDGFDASRLKFYLIDESNSYVPKTTYKVEDNKVTMRLERNSIVYIEG
ncbi:MAG: hypothetical protein J6A53_04080 [Clostridia bacterium]|nr:hypothetical protein [Clostridia bacterium]